MERVHPRQPEDYKMPATKTKLRPAKAPETQSGGTAEVLTLAEAARYLRVAEEDVLQMVGLQGLPGRKIGDDWRFLKAALQSWLSTAPAKKGLLGQIGALQDDPYKEELLKEIYARRGRPETEKD
jgi:excisionase family DNA binding protein